MRLKTENDEQIFEILMNCLTKKKIEFKVANESSGAKKGEIPKKRWKSSTISHLQQADKPRWEPQGN